VKFSNRLCNAKQFSPHKAVLMVFCKRCGAYSARKAKQCSNCQSDLEKFGHETTPKADSLLHPIQRTARGVFRGVVFAIDIQSSCPAKITPRLRNRFPRTPEDLGTTAVPTLLFAICLTRTRRAIPASPPVSPELRFNKRNRRDTAAKPECAVVNMLAMQLDLEFRRGTY
jgi:hypothetical protein